MVINIVKNFFLIICFCSVFVGFMFSLFIFIMDECGFLLGVEFREFVWEGLSVSGIRWICFNVVVIFKYSVEMISIGIRVCIVYIVIV